MLNLLYFYISTFRSMCAVPIMAVFCISFTSCFPGMLLTYFLNGFEIVPVAPIIIIIIIIIITMSFNRTQSRFVFGLLTGHNTLGRHLYIIGLSNNTTCMKCGIEEDPSVHILCQCEALASLRHTYLGSFFFWSWGYQEIMYRGNRVLW